MISFLRRKIWKNKWLVLCLILGNVILIAMATVVPLFLSATSQRLYQEEFKHIQESQDIFPTVMQLDYNFNAVAAEDRYSTFVETRETVLPKAISDMGIPVLFGEQTFFVRFMDAQLAIARELPESDRRFNLAAPEGLEQHVRLIAGRMPANELVVADRQVFDEEIASARVNMGADAFADGYIIEALAARSVLHRQNLLLDELILVQDVRSPDGAALYVRIVGVYEPAEGADLFWSLSSIDQGTTLLISEYIASEQFINDYSSQLRFSAVWTQALDWSSMHEIDIPHYLQAAENSDDFFSSSDNPWSYSINFYDMLTIDEERTDRLSITVWVLQIPIYTMLALFMYMVTKQILVLDSNEISVLRSRGASRYRILGIYALQNLFVAAISYPTGIGLGLVLCRMIGSSSGFLELAGRAPLDLRITSQVLLYGAVGMVISYLYILLPVIRMSGIAIVEKKRRNTRRSNKPVWERYFIDIVVFGFSIYLLYNFNLQREIILATLPDARGFDPFLFFGSSLFIIGASLFLLRLYPYFMKLVFLIGRGKFGSAIYAAVLKVSRSGGSEQFIMLFLIFTVSVGIFSAQSARTLNLNNEHRIRYLSGADLKLREVWDDNIRYLEELIERDHIMATFIRLPDYLLYNEPDYSRFLNFGEVDGITRVLQQTATVEYDRSRVQNTALMGIETKTFGETAWLRDDFAMIHVNYFLNALASNPRGVLLSSGFHEIGYTVGSTVNIRAEQRHGPDLVGDFVVVGFVDYWPTFDTVDIRRLETGEIVLDNQYLAVANLGYLRLLIGARPYEIWMSTNVASHRFIYDFIDENDIPVAMFYDTDRSLSEILLDPIVQSTNGILTIGFIMTMIVCIAGFLIYWILSIKERLLQFGVFRAMGMGLRGILVILISEQVLITISAMIIGGIIGALASRLFVPLLQLSYTAADQVLPMIVAAEPMDFALIYGILGFMLVLCIIVLVRFALRINVTQVLKLGED